MEIIAPIGKNQFIPETNEGTAGTSGRGMSDVSATHTASTALRNRFITVSAAYSM